MLDSCAVVQDRCTLSESEFTEFAGFTEFVAVGILSESGFAGLKRLAEFVAVGCSAVSCVSGLAGCEVLIMVVSDLGVSFGGVGLVCWVVLFDGIGSSGMAM